MHALNATQPGLLAAATRRALGSALRGTSAATHGGGDGEAHRSQGRDSETAPATSRKEQADMAPPTSDGGQDAAMVDAATVDVGEVASHDGGPGLGGPGAVELKQRLKGSADAKEVMKVQKRS